MITKEQIQSLIKDIERRTGKTQREIAIGAKYKPKTLTQLVSKGVRLESAYNRLKMAFPVGLNNSTNMEGLLVQLMERQNQLMVMQNKILEDQKEVVVSNLGDLKEGQQIIQAYQIATTYHIGQIRKGVGKVNQSVYDAETNTALLEA